jgi:hypothetical protein
VIPSAGLAAFDAERGAAYAQIRTTRTDDGKPVSDEVAIGYAVAYGLLAAGVESVEAVLGMRMFRSPTGALDAEDLKAGLSDPAR